MPSAGSDDKGHREAEPLLCGLRGGTTVAEHSKAKCYPHSMEPATSV